MVYFVLLKNVLLSYFWFFSLHFLDVSSNEMCMSSSCSIRLQDKDGCTFQWQEFQLDTVQQVMVWNFSFLFTVMLAQLCVISCNFMQLFAETGVPYLYWSLNYIVNAVKTNDCTSDYNVSELI